MCIRDSYSSDSQREASIEGQLRDCKDYAEKNGITVVGTYIDRASVSYTHLDVYKRQRQEDGVELFGQGGFAAAVGTQHGDELAPLDAGRDLSLIHI